MRKRRIILSSVACPDLPYLFALRHKRYDFQKQLLDIKCPFLFSLQLLSETFLILRSEKDMITNIYWSSGKVPIILVIF